MQDKVIEFVTTNLLVTTEFYKFLLFLLLIS